MIKVNGIAGVFLYANDPKTLAEWYTHHFGLDFLSDITDTYYMEFYYRDDNDTSKRSAHTVFAIMPAKQPLGSERGEYMINYRVDDLRGFLEQLQSTGSPLDPLKSTMMAAIQEVRGFFTWITDPEGNHLELYQPL